ncbi:MAG: hypothetical protein IPO21_00170 [Bacteroidales bacterium]|nr:hypothetical protein [Bacteroidales bacterium]
MNNVGDIVVPEGTIISWNFETQDMKNLFFSFSDSTKIELDKEDFKYSLKKSFKKSTQYSLIAENQYFNSYEIIKYNITVIPDNFPEIAVVSIRDSLQFSNYYYKGIIKDDYGFTALKFILFNKQDSSQVLKVDVPFEKSSAEQEFYFTYDFSALQDIDEIEYIFQITDNDGVNGFKSTKSLPFFYKQPSHEEINEVTDSLSNNVNSNLQKSKSLSSEIENDLNNLKKKLLQENLSDWQKKELINEIAEKQKSLKNMLKQASDLNKMKNEVLNQNTQQQQDILDKQKQIEELLEKVMDKELDNLMKELQSLMENFDKTKLFKLSDDMKMSFEDLSEELDKNLEMLKKFEVEQDIQQSIQELKKLSEEFKELSESVKNKDKDELKNVDSLKSKLEEIQKEYKNAAEKNKDIKDPLQLDSFENEFEKLKQSISESKELLDSKKNSKASQSLKKNEEDTKSLSQMMQDMMDANAKKQSMEDIDNLRKILDNLITFSFKQEEIMNELRDVSSNNPKFPQVAKKQNILKENFEIIDDSLSALAGRVPAINSLISSEVLKVKKNLVNTIDAIEQMQKGNATRRQQEILTSVNNLSLLLSDILKQMQQQAAQKMSGQQQCQNPSQGNQGKPSFQQMTQMQQSMKDQLKKMIEQMKQPGGTKPGQEGSMGKQMGQMLAKQQMFKDMISKMMNENSLSPETVKQLNEISKMLEKNETDIINNNITPQTLFRQDQIITRLLESEKAERERDLDIKRESEQAKELYSNPKNFFQNTEEKDKVFNENLFKPTIKLHNFYKKKYEQYMLNISNIK